jgi:LAS superfamily LD-carboxypeptidase LdcB
MKEKYGDTSLSESKIVSLIKEKEKPRMTKKSLMEYIKNPKKVVKKVSKKDMIKEQYENLEVPEGFTGMDLKFIFKYLEALRKSGLINMFGASPLLNWTKEDMERWLYGQRKDINSLEDEEEINIINLLIDKKQQVRDTLIRVALRKAENSDNYSDSKIQRYFEKAANEALRVFINIR